MKKILTLIAFVLCSAFVYAEPNDNLRNWSSQQPDIFIKQATNGIHFQVIPVTGNYTISDAETNAMWTTNLVYSVDTTAGNISIQFPFLFVNTFTIYNVGTNWVICNAANGRTFLTAPATGGITYSTSLNNKYALKSQQFFMLNESNYVVSSDFRPLPNIIFDVTNNIAIGTGGGAAYSDLTAGTNAVKAYADATFSTFANLTAGTNAAKGYTDAQVTSLATFASLTSGTNAGKGYTDVQIVLATNLAQLNAIMGTPLTNRQNGVNLTNLSASTPLNATSGNALTVTANGTNSIGLFITNAPGSLNSNTVLLVVMPSPGGVSNVIARINGTNGVTGFYVNDQGVASNNAAMGISGTVTAPTFVGALTGTASGNPTFANLTSGTNAAVGFATASTNSARVTIQSTNTFNRSVYSTNQPNGFGTLTNIDSLVAWSWGTTNAGYQITGFSNLISGTIHVFSQIISNSSGSSIVISNPLGSHIGGPANGGVANTNGLSVASGKEARFDFFIRPNIETNIWNQVSQ
jgi:hypothetical protein